MFKERPIVITAYIVCTIFAVLAVTPFFWVLMTALKTNPEINAWPPQVFPRQPTLEHFYQILGKEKKHFSDQEEIAAWMGGKRGA